jgi:hypothetical protein
MPEFTRFICPGCQKRFKIPAGKTKPEFCPACAKVDRSVAASPPAAFDDLAAAVRAEQIEARAKVTAAENQKIQEEQARGLSIVFKSAEAAETVKTVFVPAPSRWQRLRVARRKPLIIGALSAMTFAVLYFSSVALRQPKFPEDAAAWSRAKKEISEYLLAPKTAEFPQSGEIERFRADNRSASVKSFVDAKNANGVPIRLRWEVSLEANAAGSDWNLIWAELEGKPVFIDPAIRAEAAGIDRKNAAERERVTTAARDDRRARGGWRDIRHVEGRKYEHLSFTTSERGFRVVWHCPGGARISLRGAEGFIRDLAKRPAGREPVAVDVPDLPPGTYQLVIESEVKWTITIQE